MPRAAIWSAISRMTAEPLPLSLMPGPRGGDRAGDCPAPGAPGVAAGGAAHRSVARPLSRADTDSLVRALTRTGGSEAATRRREEHVWRISEGNPFAAVEVMRALDAVPARLADASWLPERVREVIAGRLERLSPNGRELASIGAVIGRDF
jgi:hypothetical protein